MSTKRTISSLVIFLLITASLSSYAANQLKVVRTSSNSIDIQLANTEGIAGVQCRVRTSKDIVVESMTPGDLTQASSWMVESYQTSDSVMNVLILNTRQIEIPNGSGTLLSLHYTTINRQNTSSVELINVLVINAHGDSLGVTISNLLWNGNSLPWAGNDDSKSFVLGQNFPNPFNPSTNLTYRLNTAGYVRLSIFDITGREVSRLIDQYQNVGDYNVRWDSNLRNGQKLASGMYIARLNVDNYSVSRKMLLTK